MLQEIATESDKHQDERLAANGQAEDETANIIQDNYFRKKLFLQIDAFWLIQ